MTFSLISWLNWDICLHFSSDESGYWVLPAAAPLPIQEGGNLNTQLCRLSNRSSPHPDSSRLPGRFFWTIWASMAEQKPWGIQIRFTCVSTANQCGVAVFSFWTSRLTSWKNSYKTLKSFLVYLGNYALETLTSRSKNDHLTEFYKRWDFSWNRASSLDGPGGFLWIHPITIGRSHFVVLLFTFRNANAQ